MVVKPTLSLSSGMIFAILAGCFYGAFLVASRWLATLASGKMMLLTQLSIGTLLLAPFGLASIPAFSAPMLGYTMVSALGSALGNLFLILAYQKMQASKLAPLVYFQLVAATIFGIWLFDTIPDMWSLIGLAVLLLSGLGSLLLPKPKPELKPKF